MLHLVSIKETIGIMTQPNLIQALEQRQRDEGMTDQQFASEIGVSRQMWGLMRSGDRMPGRKTLGRIIERFPEYTSLAAFFALDIDTNMHISDSIDSELAVTR